MREGGIGQRVEFEERQSETYVGKGSHIREVLIEEPLKASDEPCSPSKGFSLPSLLVDAVFFAYNAIARNQVRDHDWRHDSWRGPIQDALIWCNSLPSG